MSGTTEARWIFPCHGFPVFGLNTSAVTGGVGERQRRKAKLFFQQVPQQLSLGKGLISFGGLKVPLLAGQSAAAEARAYQTLPCA